ncbi:MAG: DUF2156 domain-containing protein [Blautia sp.]|nr:DUF2156 domain-containing protein [Blautia sp.]
MTGLDFRPLSLEDKETVDSYMIENGDGSCQHSFVSMYFHQEKYGDRICIQNGFLYTLRTAFCDEEYRVYLAPMGKGDLKEAYEQVFRDAAAHQKKVKFFTITQAHADFLDQEFPQRFISENSREYGEYFYKTEKMMTFSGGELSKRRREINQFWTLYGEHVTVESISPENAEEIRDFEHAWVESYRETHDEDDLLREERMIAMHLEQFGNMGFRGVLLRYDGEVIGFTYGAKLGDYAFDDIVEKGNRTYKNIHKVLRKEMAKQCQDCRYINVEEDLGIKMLRDMKLQYQPEFLLAKFIAYERSA